MRTSWEFSQTSTPAIVGTVIAGWAAGLTLMALGHMLRVVDESIITP